MSGCKCNISLIIVLVSLFSIQAFSQQINYRDSLAEYNSQKVNLKPKLYYSVGSTFIIVPHLGTVSGFTFSPFLSIPLSPKLSIDGGIIAGRFYSAYAKRPYTLTTFGRWKKPLLTYSNIKKLTPTKGGQWHWLFQTGKRSILTWTQQNLV